MSFPRVSLIYNCLSVLLLNSSAWVDLSPRGSPSPLHNKTEQNKTKARRRSGIFGSHLSYWRWMGCKKVGRQCISIGYVVRTCVRSLQEPWIYLRTLRLPSYQILLSRAPPYSSRPRPLPLSALWQGVGSKKVFSRSEASNGGHRPLIGEAQCGRFRRRAFRDAGTSARRRGGFLWSPATAAPLLLNLSSDCPGAVGRRC